LLSLKFLSALLAIVSATSFSVPAPAAINAIIACHTLSAAAPTFSAPAPLDNLESSFKTEFNRICSSLVKASKITSPEAILS